MLKALVIKELRESGAIIALAVLAAVFAVVTLTGVPLLPIFSSQESNAIPFVSDSFTTLLAFIVGPMAVALGLKQSTWEFFHSTYYFLLHRPAPRSRIFWTKLATGCVVLLALGAAMIVIYGAWAAAPEHTGVPFEWSMTGPSWQLVVCMVPLYLSAFLTGIRPARWFGTRLAPLVCAVAVLMFAVLALRWWIITVVAAMLAALMLAGIFYYVRQRDY